MMAKIMQWFPQYKNQSIPLSLQEQVQNSNLFNNSENQNFVRDLNLNLTVSTGLTPDFTNVSQATNPFIINSINYDLKTDNSFICSQNDNLEILLLLGSIALKCLDHLVSGYLLFISSGRGIFKIYYDEHGCMQIFCRVLGLVLVFFIFFILTPLLFVVPASSNLFSIFSYIDFQSTVYQYLKHFNTVGFVTNCKLLGYSVLGLWASIGGAFFILIGFKLRQFVALHG